MSVETELRASLLASATLTAIVGQNVYPGQAPQSIGPSASYVIYQRGPDDPIMCLDGATGLVNCRFSLECIGGSYSQSCAIASACRSALSTWLLDAIDDVVYQADDGSDLVIRGRRIEVSKLIVES